jgi:hypothetical protein
LGATRRPEATGDQGRGPAEARPLQSDREGDRTGSAAGGQAQGVSRETRPDSGPAAGGVGGDRVKSKRESDRESTGVYQRKRTRGGQKHKKKKGNIRPPTKQPLLRLGF